MNKNVPYNNVTGEIPVADLPQGVYILKIYTGKDVEVSKIMKE